MPEETVIEFESVKKGRKALFFVLIGIFVATSIAFMLLWILKPEGSKVSVEKIELSSPVMKTERDVSGNQTYIASVGETYTVYADVSLIGDAETAVEWSFSPSSAIKEISRGADPENPRRSMFTFMITNLAGQNPNGSTEITVRARSPFGKEVIEEFKFTARPNYAVGGVFESITMGVGERSFPITKIGENKYSVTLPYMSTNPEEEFTMFRVNMSQHAAASENGEYFELTKGITGNEGKNIDAIKYSVSNNDEKNRAVELRGGSESESTFIKVLKDGKATLTARLNGYNDGAEVDVTLDITTEDIVKNDKVLSSVRFGESAYYLYLDERDANQMFDFSGEVSCVPEKPNSGTWKYEIYESDERGNQKDSAARILQRSDRDGKVFFGPRQNGTAADTFVTVRDTSSDGYGVYHTVAVHVRNPVETLSVTTADGKTTASNYQGDNATLTVTYGLQDCEQENVPSSGITGDLYFYYADPVNEPGTGNFTTARGFVTIGGMRYVGEIDEADARRKIYAVTVSPSALKVGKDSKEATTTLRVNIGAQAPQRPVMINFVTFPQSSSVYPTDISGLMLPANDKIFVKADAFTGDVLRTVTTLRVKSKEVLNENKDFADDGARFFQYGEDNNYRLVRPAGVTAVSGYSIYDLFEYVGTGGDIHFGDNIPSNLKVEILDGDSTVLDGKMRIAGNATENNTPVKIKVTLDKGDKNPGVFTIEIYHKVIAEDAVLPLDTPVHSTYMLNDDAYRYDGKIGFVSKVNGAINNVPGWVQFYDVSVRGTVDNPMQENNPKNIHNVWADKGINIQQQFPIQRYIFIDGAMLVKKSKSEITLSVDEGMSYYFFTDEESATDSKYALFKMNSDGFIFVNRDLYAVGKNNNNKSYDNIIVVYSAYEIKVGDNGSIIIDGGEYYGTEEYDNYTEFTNNCNLKAGRRYVPHRGFDKVAFVSADSENSPEISGYLNVNVGSEFTLYPVGIIKYFNDSMNGFDEHKVRVSADNLYGGSYVGSVAVTNNKPNDITPRSGVNKYIVSVTKGKIDGAFTLSAADTDGNIKSVEQSNAQKSFVEALLSLDVSDMFLPIDDITMHMSASDAASGTRPIAADSAEKIFGLVNNFAAGSEITLYFRVKYQENKTGYQYLSGLKFTVGGREAVSTAVFDTFTMTVADNPSHDVNDTSNLIPAAAGLQHRVITVTFKINDGNSKAGSYSVVAEPRTAAIPNQSSKAEFGIDVANHATGVNISGTEDGDSLKINIERKADSATLEENKSAVINVESVGGDNSRLVVENIINADESCFIVSQDSDNSKKLTVTSTGKTTSQPLDFTFDVYELRYMPDGTQEKHYLGRHTVHVSVAAQIFAINFGGGESPVEIKVSGGEGTANAEFSVSFNTADTDDIIYGEEEKIRYSIENTYNGAIYADGKKVFVKNGIPFTNGNITTYIVASIDGAPHITQRKQIVISSLDKPLVFANFKQSGSDFSVRYDADNGADRVAELRYFGASMQINLALDGIQNGDGYSVKYELVGVQSAETMNQANLDKSHGIVTLGGRTANTFTVKATVEIMPSGADSRKYEKTLTVEITAYGGVASFGGLESIAGYKGETDGIVYIDMYEHASVNINVEPKSADGKDVSAGYTLEKPSDGEYDVANNSLISISGSNIKLGGVSDAQNGQYAYVRIVAENTDGDSSAPFEKLLGIKLIKLSDGDKKISVKRGGAVLENGSTVDASNIGGDEFTAEFGTSVVETLKSLYGATVKYTFSAVGGAASFDESTGKITVNPVKSGSFTVSATVTFGGYSFTTDAVTINVANEVNLEVSYGVADGNNLPANPVSSGSLDIGYDGNLTQEKFVYVFIDYAKAGLAVPEITDANISAYFKPYASGKSGVSVSLVKTGHSGTKFYAGYSVKADAFDSNGLKSGVLGSVTLGGTVMFGGFSYNASEVSVSLTATAPNISLPAAGTQTLNPSVYGEAANELSFSASGGNYTFGNNYTVDYTVLDGDMSGGEYNDAGNMISFAVGSNGRAKATAKSYVSADGKIVSYSRNSIRVMVGVTITKGIYAGYTQSRIVTVSVSEYDAPSLELNTSFADSDSAYYSSEYGGLVFAKNYSLLVHTGNVLDADVFTINSDSEDTGFKYIVASDQRIQAGNTAKQETETLKINITGGYFNGAKLELPFEVFVLPSAELSVERVMGMPDDRFATAEHNVKVTVTADRFTANPVITLSAGGDLGYFTAGEYSAENGKTVYEATFVPTAGKSGTVIVSAYVKYTDGGFENRIVNVTPAEIGVITATLNQNGTSGQHVEYVSENGIEKNKIFVQSGGSFAIPDAVKLSGADINVSGYTKTVKFELINGLYANGTLSVSGSTISSPMGSNYGTGERTFENALRFTLEYKGGINISYVYVNYFDVVILPRALADGDFRIEGADNAIGETKLSVEKLNGVNADITDIVYSVSGAGFAVSQDGRLTYVGSAGKFTDTATVTAKITALGKTYTATKQITMYKPLELGAPTWDKNGNVFTVAFDYAAYGLNKDDITVSASTEASFGTLTQDADNPLKFTFARTSLHAGSGAVSFTVRVKDGVNSVYKGLSLSGDRVISVDADLPEKPVFNVSENGSRNFALSIGGNAESVEYTATVTMGTAAVPNANVIIQNATSLTNGSLSYSVNTVKVPTAVSIRVTASVETEYYGTVVLEYYINETVNATLDPMPVLNITASEQASGAHTITVSATGGNIKDIELIVPEVEGLNVTKTASAGVYSYTFTTNNASKSISVTAVATVDGGDHDGKGLRKEQNITVYRTSAQGSLPTLVITHDSDSHRITVTSSGSVTDITVEVNAKSGETLENFTLSKISDGVYVYSFVSAANQDVVVKASAKTSGGWYNGRAVSASEDVTITPTHVPSETPVLTLTHNAKDRTFTVSANVNVANIMFAGITVTATETAGVYKYTFDETAGLDVTVTVFATVDAADSDYNGTIIKSNSVTVKIDAVTPPEPDAESGAGTENM